MTSFSNVARGETDMAFLYVKLSTDNVLTVCYDNNWGYYVNDGDGGYYMTYDGVECFFLYSDIMDYGDLGRALQYILVRYTSAHTVVFDNSLNNLRNIPIKDASDLFRTFGELTDIVGWENLDMSQITDISNMFNSCYSLKNVDLSSFHTENVTNMKGLFAACFSLENVDLSHFNTSNVKNAVGMFGGCQSLKTIDLSNFVFNSSDPTSEYYALFENCTSLETVRMGSLKCKNIKRMFYGDTALKTLEFTGPVSGFERCSSMFENCTSLEGLDLSLLDTSNAYYMDRIFAGCSSLISLDLSNFNTSNTAFTDAMFYNCSNIVSIYVGDGWDVSNVPSSNYMFGYCYSIVGQDGTTYNESEIDASKAHYGAGGYLRYIGGIVPTNLNPIDGETTINLPTEDDVEDRVIDNVYYNLKGNNGYDSTEGCIIINTTTDIETVDGEPGSETVKDYFTGLIFLVEGNGVIELDCQTLGVDVLNVKVGSQEPTTISKNERGIIEVAYDVTEPTYVYVYATSARVGAPLRVSASENCVKLWSLTVKPGATLGISHTTATSPIGEEMYYTLDGRKVVNPTKGVYIYKGKKLVIK